MIKRFLLCTLLTLLLAAAGAGIMTWQNRELYPKFCAGLYASENWIYGIDYDAENRQVRIYRCTADGRNTTSIETDAELSDTCLNYDQIIYDPDEEKVYVHAAEFVTETGMLLRETVFLCDFEKLSLKPVWKIPLENVSQNYAYAVGCRIRDGNLVFLTETEETLCLRRSDGLVEREIAYSDAALFSQYHFDEQGRVSAFSYTSGLYCEDEESVLQPVSGETDVWSSYASPIWGETEITFLNPAEQQELTFSAGDGSLKQKAMKGSYTAAIMNGSGAECNIEPDMLTSYSYCPGGGFIAYTELPDGIVEDDSRFQYGLAVYQNGKMKVYPTLSYTKAHLQHVFLIHAGKLAAVLFALMVVGFALYAVKRKQNYISLRLEMVIYSVLLFGAAIMVAVLTMWSAMSAFYVFNYEKTLTALENQIFGELDMLIDQTPDFSEETLSSPEFYAELEEILLNLSVRNPTTGKDEFAPYYLFHVQDENGELQILYNPSGLERVPSSYLYDNSYLLQEFHEVQTGTPWLTTTQYDTGGTWYVQLCYYENTEYQVKGVLEIVIDSYLTDWKMRQFTNSTTGMLLLFCLLVVIVVVMFLGVSLSPIRRLGRQVEQGNVEKPDNKRWSSEVIDIWERLYVMISNANRRQEELEKNNREYYRFISHELVEMLGLDELADAVPSTRRRCSLDIVCAAFQERSLEKMTALYQLLPDRVAQYGGVLLTMDLRHAIWLFVQKQGKPLTAAECIRQTAKEQEITCGIGIGSGSNVLFVQGTEESADIAISGAEAQLAQRLAEYASLQGDQCLLTEEAAALAVGNQWEKQTVEIQEGLTCWEIRNHQSVKV